MAIGYRCTCISLHFFLMLHQKAESQKVLCQGEDTNMNMFQSPVCYGKKAVGHWSHQLPSKTSLYVLAQATIDLRTFKVTKHVHNQPPIPNRQSLVLADPWTMMVVCFYCCPQPVWDLGSTNKAQRVMGYFDCPVTVECKHVASEWLQSADPLIQDFGARWLGSALMVDG